MITNSSGGVTSAVAHLTVYEPIPDLFNTGVDNNRVGSPTAPSTRITSSS